MSQLKDIFDTENSGLDTFMGLPPILLATAQ